MAGIHFSFIDFKQLLALNIGVAERLDENRSESFTLLYCNLEGIDQEVIDYALENILRTSDSIVNHGKHYFFVLLYTDKYGANIVKKMFDEALSNVLPCFMLSYPIDGEKPEDLLSNLQDNTSAVLNDALPCLDRFARAI